MFLVFALLLFASFANAHEVRASITGTVSDSTGAPVRVSSSLSALESIV